MTPSGKRVEELLTEQLHVAGEHDHARPALPDPRRQRLIARAPVRELRALEHGARDAARLRPLQRPRAGQAGCDGDDLGVAAVNAVKQRLQVRALSGHQHSDGEGLAHAGRTIAVSNVTEECPPRSFNQR